MGTSLGRMFDLRHDASGLLTESLPLFDDGLPAHFGGRILAQALSAAASTVPAYLRPHSIHANFVDAGRPGIPSTYDVTQVRDGRLFATRVVAVRQGERAVLHASVSFHGVESGEEWGLAGEPAEPFGSNGLGMEQLATPIGEFEVRLPDGVSEGGWPRHPFWIRSRERLGDDPAVHASVLAYVSDMGIVWAARGAGTEQMLVFRLASLDHALWLHVPARADEWLQFSAEPVVNYGGRGLARGQIRTADGRLVASVAQEALLRPPTIR